MSYETKIAFFFFIIIVWVETFFFLKAEKLQAVKLKQIKEAEVDR